ncbi:hypothetical protein [Microvirga antarctica]|uniref:hypothetical protein n=1 Tax=Microvirga antarctica TaxID=2819233 RepID=UPI001B301EE7|nr:hypothetical protein [Microvirga antarctica]
MIGTTELLALVEREYGWWDSLCRRARESTSDAALLPVKDLGGRKWAKFDLEDSFCLKLALDIERGLGISFRQATKLVFNAGALELLTRSEDEPDFWIAFVQDAPEGRRHLSGSLADVLSAFSKHAPASGDAVALAFGCVNASLSFRELRERARILDLTDALGV